jgi:recombinational DNA repair protein (RecF pathway)
MYEQCCVCGTFLQPESKYLDQDDAYEIEGNILCENCWMDWVRKNCYKKLKEEKLPFEIETDHELLQRKSKTHRELEYGGNEE